MAYNTNPLAFEASPNQVLAEESARVFMARVYRWMTLGLLTTGVVAVGVASSPELSQTVFGLRWLIWVGQIGLVIALSWGARRMSGPVAALLFLVYSAAVGLTLSVVFLVFQIASIGTAFLLTAGTFGALSVYGTVTKKNLSAWGSFLFIGLVGLILASVVNLFMRSDGLSFVISCAAVVVFAGLTAYDTQKLRQYHASSGYSSAMTLSVVGALMLYLDFINLFLALLRLVGRRR